jgi:tyrosyl-tRNA synthetase
MLQAYDSTQMLADVEFGGTDQKFNCLLGRQLQGLVGQTPQQVVLVPLLVAPDGAKMSKSLGNAIGITEPAGEMFGKVMSIRDDLMADYFRLVTDVPDAEIQAMAAGMAEGSLNPRDAKLRLASEIVLQFHGADAARQAREEFERVFSRKELPADMPDLSVGGEATVDIASLLVAAGHFASKGEVRRLLSQGAVELAGVKLDQALIPADRLKDGDVLRVGKRTFLRVRKA